VALGLLVTLKQKAELPFGGSAFFLFKAYFYREFARKYHQTPREYRSQK